MQLRLPSRPRPAWPGEVAIIAVLLFGYDRIADMAHVRIPGAVTRGSEVLALERGLHVAVERPLNLLAAQHLRLGQAFALYYDLAHFIVTLGVLIGVYLLRPGSYARSRRGLIAVNVLALAAFVALPVAPPRLLPGAGFVDVVARSGTWSSWEASSTLVRHANQYASMPSLHVAWALWVVLAVAAATRRPGLRRLALAHLLLTVAVVLMTGNHYLLDVAAGAAVGALGWAVTATREPVGARGGVLIVTASMGAGHDGVAYELARRWEERGTPVTVVDYLHVLPARMGQAIRGVYSAQLHHAPASYEWLYDAMERRPLFNAIGGFIAGTARRRLLRIARRGQHRLVVCTYPLAARAVGQLRREGRLAVPAATFLTDVDVHATWLDRGTDLYLAVYGGSADAASMRTGRPAVATGPVLPPVHDRVATADERRLARERLGLQPEGKPVVLVVTGSWGVGAIRPAVVGLRDNGALPVVLCGRNESLRASLDLPGVHAVGWTDDVRSLYAAADVVVHNAGGLSSLEAFGAGRPVIGHACLPGHGLRNARAMADAGVAALAVDDEDLVRLVGELAGTPAGAAMAARARNLFRLDATEVLDTSPALAVPAPTLRARARRPLRAAAVAALLPVAFGVTSFGVSEATEKGFGVTRSPRNASAVYVAVELGPTLLRDPRTAPLLAAARVSAVVSERSAKAAPAGVRALTQGGVTVLAQFPRLPATPGAAKLTCVAARDEVARAADGTVPSLVSLDGLGAWSLSSAHRAHLPIGVATPVRSAAGIRLRAGDQVVVDVPADALRATLAAVGRSARAARLEVDPLGLLWARS